MLMRLAGVQSSVTICSAVGPEVVTTHLEHAHLRPAEGANLEVRKYVRSFYGVPHLPDHAETGHWLSGQTLVICATDPAIGAHSFSGHESSLAALTCQLFHSSSFSL